MTTPQLLKADLRRQCLAARAILAVETPQAGAAAAARLIPLLTAADKIIAGYVTIGSEIDCAPALAALTATGVTVVLPVTAGQGVCLQFRVWRPGEVLERGPFGTSHPGPAAAVLEPDLLIVPLLAFDATGHRLGYGAGYYDRTLAALRAARPIRAVGLAFDGQEVGALPADVSDERLDAVVTQSRTLVFSDAFA